MEELWQTEFSRRRPRLRRPHLEPPPEGRERPAESRAGPHRAPGRLPVRRARHLGPPGIASPSRGQPTRDRYVATIIALWRMTSVSSNEGVRPLQTTRGRTLTSRSSAADRSNQLGAEDLELLATSAYMLGREEDYLRLLERAHRAHLDAGEPLAALRCAFWIGVTLAAAGRWVAPAAGSARAQRLLEREGGRPGRAGLPAPAARLRAGGERRPRGGRRDRGRGRGDRRALRRPGPLRARRPRAGPHPDPARAPQGGPGAAGRVDGGGHRRRALPDRLRDRLLRRDPRLPGCPRASPRAGVDCRPVRLVRAPARPGRLHRPLPGASRRDHAAARRLVGGARGGAAGSRALPAGREPGGSRGGLLPAGGDPPPARAISGRPRRPTGRRAGAGGSRSRAWRCCGWRRERPTPPRQRSAGCDAEVCRARQAGRTAARIRRDHARRR